MILKTLVQFKGKINQVPPVFSAKKLNGKRAYDYARKGKEFELQPNMVFIRETELIEFNKPVVVIRIKCGKGTYIRALARDFGKALNSGAHLIALRRISIGDYKVSDALTMKEFEEKLKFL
jgi:tRNA pseudouridine55 synthase